MCSLKRKGGFQKRPKVVLFGVSEAYSKSKGGEVWVQCMVFQQWAHESCTPAENSNICHNC